MEINEGAVAAFEAETGTAPVVNVSGADAPTVNTEAVKTEAKGTPKFYTEDDLAKVRSQEKDKLYPVIEQLKEEVASLKKKDEEKAAKRAEKDARKALEEKEEAEAEMDVRELLKNKEQEWQEQLERERQERERAFALLEQERAFTDLQNYKNQRIAEERENIIPELVDLLSGSSREEIDSSLEGLKERSARILESAQQAMQATRRDMAGTRATLPPAGPLENNSSSRQFTAAEIAAMSVQEYSQYREKLLSEKARGVTSGLLG